MAKKKLTFKEEAHKKLDKMFETCKLLEVETKHGTESVKRNGQNVLTCTGESIVTFRFMER